MILKHKNVLLDICEYILIAGYGGGERTEENTKKLIILLSPLNMHVNYDHLYH